MTTASDTFSRLEERSIAPQMERRDRLGGDTLPQPYLREFEHHLLRHRNRPLWALNLQSIDPDSDVMSGAARCSPT